MTTLMCDALKPHLLTKQSKCEWLVEMFLSTIGQEWEIKTQINQEPCE